jgi:hypothetical protein
MTFLSSFGFNNHISPSRQRSFVLMLGNCVNLLFRGAQEEVELLVHFAAQTLPIVTA